MNRGIHRGVYIAERGLACALGRTLPESVTRLAAGALPQTRQADHPFFAIAPAAPADAAAWTARARQIVIDVVSEAGGDAIRHAPLFIASSSLNMGAIERGQQCLDDMHAEAEVIASWVDWQGPVFWISTACTSSINALISASTMMRSGRCDDALILGIELSNDYTLSGFAAMQLLSATSSQPLGATRDGLVLGEAVAALRLGCIPQRWAIAGAASVVSHRDATGASHDAVLACWQEASMLAGQGNSIDVLKLQAAGSPGNDAIELGAIDEAFANTPALTSLKAHIGHTLGASGAAEIALLTAALEAEVWPRVTCAQDPELPHGLSDAAPAAQRSLLASIIGFGGSHACAVLHDSGIARDPEAWQMLATTWEVCGRSGPALPEGWREELAALLGQRPRRIGAWAEAGLYGALKCMRQAGEAVLPTRALLRMASLHGPMAAIRQTLQTIAEDGMAMPFGFLQSQPGQLPAIIAQALQWQGNARIANHRDPLALLRIACDEAGPEGVLIGWIEEAQPAAMAISHWMRLRPATALAHLTFSAATVADVQTCRYLRVSRNGLEVATEETRAA